MGTIGSLFLYTSESNTDLLMNCLAVNFILDSDEMIFAFLTPPQTQRTIESIPPFESDKDELSPLATILQRCSMLFKLFGSGLIVALLWVMHPECDLNPCEACVLDPCNDSKYTCPFESLG